ncbi:CLUMA_CG006423, isoform A [Clunio marinus]|uniref:CLUMA_CG006423, isoform A n=1 Tax=Clunio marinus TaxID=568069 RepID=A0A1J1HXR7_9DIPT|nr:CLUMA_CG006423, isoform A [Clunio marinus]
MKSDKQEERKEKENQEDKSKAKHNHIVQSIFDLISHKQKLHVNLLSSSLSKHISFSDNFPIHNSYHSDKNENGWIEIKMENSPYVEGFITTRELKLFT